MRALDAALKLTGLFPPFSCRPTWLRGAHTQKLRDEEGATGEAERERHEAPGGVDEHLRLDESNIATADSDLTAAGSEDVLDPVGLRPVRQREHVVVAALQQEDWSPIAAPADAAGVGQGDEPGQPAANNRVTGLTMCVVNRRRNQSLVVAATRLCPIGGSPRSTESAWPLVIGRKFIRTTLRVSAQVSSSRR